MNNLFYLLRERARYGDNYVPGKWHAFIAESWAGVAVLNAAECHIEHGRSCYQASTVPVALNWIDCGGLERAA